MYTVITTMANSSAPNIGGWNKSRQVCYFYCDIANAYCVPTE